MNQLGFSFGNALNHFSRIGGQKGFLWKFVLAYVSVALTFQALSVWLQWPIYDLYIRIFTEGGGDVTAYTEELNRLSMRNLGVSALILPVTLIYWTLFEAANQRRYMRGEGFSLKFGKDELNIAVVGLIWFGVLIGWYFAFFIGILIVSLIGLVGGGIGVAIGMVLGSLGGLFLLLWITARLSPAAALTIRDNQIRFFEAWRVTRGKTGTLMGVIIVIWLLTVLLLGIAVGVPLFLAFSQFAPLVGSESLTQADIFGIVRNPAFFMPAILGGVIYSAILAAAMHIGSGPAALAAKTDPAWVGQKTVSETFS